MNLPESAEGGRQQRPGRNSCIIGQEGEEEKEEGKAALVNDDVNISLSVVNAVYLSGAMTVSISLSILMLIL